MDKQFILGTRKIDLQPGARIVRREELNVLYDADEIISKAAQAAERIEQKAQEDYQRRYEEGFAQGQEEGKSEYAMKIMEMVMTQLDSLEGLEQQLTEVVIISVHKGTFYANLVYDRGITVECKAADAIALALHFSCPIYALDSIVESENIVPDINRARHRTVSEEIERMNKKLEEAVAAYPDATWRTFLSATASGAGTGPAGRA